MLSSACNSICHFFPKINPYFNFFRHHHSLSAHHVLSITYLPIPYHITSLHNTRYNLLYIFNIVITLILSGKTLTRVHNFRQTILGLFLFIMQIQKLTPYSCIYLPIHIIYHYYFLIPIQENAVM